jgi:hypothetical protein
MLHQFEEHGYDIYGRRFHFLQEFCTFLSLGSGPCPLNAFFIFAVNVIGVWSCYVFGIIAGRKYSAVGACGLALMLLNGFIHLRMFVISHAYNSGLLTSVVLFIPISLWSFYILYQLKYLDAKQIVFGLVIGVLMHVGIFVALKLPVHENVIFASLSSLGALPCLGFLFPNKNKKF